MTRTATAWSDGRAARGLAGPAWARWVRSLLASLADWWRGGGGANGPRPALPPPRDVSLGPTVDEATFDAPCGDDLFTFAATVRLRWLVQDHVAQGQSVKGLRTACAERVRPEAVARVTAVVREVTRRYGPTEVAEAEAEVGRRLGDVLRFGAQPFSCRVEVWLAYEAEIREFLRQERLDRIRRDARAARSPDQHERAWRFLGELQDAYQDLDSYEAARRAEVAYRAAAAGLGLRPPRMDFDGDEREAPDGTTTPPGEDWVAADSTASSVANGSGAYPPA